jgi:hypothetical protein
LLVMRWTWVSQPPSKHFCLRRLTLQQQQRLFKTANTNSWTNFVWLCQTNKFKSVLPSYASIWNLPRNNKNSELNLGIIFMSKIHSLNLLNTGLHKGWIGKEILFNYHFVKIWTLKLWHNLHFLAKPDLSRPTVKVNWVKDENKRPSRKKRLFS